MRRAKADETKSVLRDCISRVNSIAVVHEFLAQQGSGTVDMAAVAQGIYKAVLSGMAAPELRLTTGFSADNVVIPSEKATSMALVLNEMLQNCFDHAFTGRTQGAISVELKKQKAAAALPYATTATACRRALTAFRRAAWACALLKPWPKPIYTELLK